MRIAGTLDLPSDWGLLKRRMLISRGTLDSLRDSIKDGEVGDVGDVGKVRDDRRSYRHVFSSYVLFSGSLWLS